MQVVLISAMRTISNKKRRQYILTYLNNYENGKRSPKKTKNQIARERGWKQ